MKILQLLGMSKEAKEKKAIQRTGRALKRQQEALVDKLEAKKDKQEMIIEDLLNINADNVSENWNENYHNAKVELAMIEKEIQIAKEITLDLFTDEK